MKLKYILLALFGMSFILSMNSCGDSWLELAPGTGIPPEKAIESEKDAQYFLNGIYSVFRSSGYYGGRYTYYGDVTGDDMQARGDTKRSAKFYLFRSSESSSPESFWKVPYVVIRNANFVLEYADRLDPKTMSDNMKNIKGQALTIRAMAHFDLVKAYGYPYTKDNGASLGVPIELERHDQTSKPARNTVAEVYNNVILPDLKEALTLLSNKPSKGRINKFSAQLLLARAYLYMGNDTDAYTEATSLIKAAEKAKYKLWSNEEYTKVWAEENTSELLFEIINVVGEAGSGRDGVGFLMWRRGYDDIILTYSFVDFLNSDPKDIRNKLVTKANITDKKTGITTTYYYLNKYQGSDGLSPIYSSIPVLRLSEAYLIAAEAAVKKGDNKKALGYLNPIVERANPAATVSGTVTLDRVLDEYRKEFVGEGHRFFDAMRNNKQIERTGDSHLSMKTSRKSFNWDTHFIVLPIGREEIEANPNIKQNPKYTSILESDSE